MGRVKEISPTVGAQIHILSQEGYTQRVIAARLNISLSCVCKTLARVAEKGDYSSRQRSGRPTITTPQGDRMICRYCVAHPFASSAEIKANIPVDQRFICTSTIRRRLIKQNLSAYTPVKKPLLSAKNIRDRISFCRRHQHWTVQQWSSVMFTDETKVSQFRSN